MKFVAAFLIVATAVPLLACNKSEDAPAPAAPPPAVETPPAAPAAVPEQAAPAVPPAAVQPEVSPAAPPAPAAASKPAASAPAESRPAPASSPAPDLAHGQQIYRQACAFCHDRGTAGAPKPGDAAAWSVRLAQGMDALYAATLRGKGAMPPKGGNRSLSEADVKAAVDYLVAQSR